MLEKIPTGGQKKQKEPGKKRFPQKTVAVLTAAGLAVGAAGEALAAKNAESGSQSQVTKPIEQGVKENYAQSQKKQLEERFGVEIVMPGERGNEKIVARQYVIEPTNHERLDEAIVAAGLVKPRMSRHDYLTEEVFPLGGKEGETKKLFLLEQEPLKDTTDEDVQRRARELGLRRASLRDALAFAEQHPEAFVSGRPVVFCLERWPKLVLQKDRMRNPVIILKLESVTPNGPPVKTISFSSSDELWQWRYRFAFVGE